MGTPGPRESYIERKVCKHGEKTGWLVRKVQWQGRRGAPDRLFMGFGLHVWIEFKQWGKKPEDHQAREHQRMLDHGVTVYVIDNIEDGVFLLDRLRSTAEVL